MTAQVVLRHGAFASTLHTTDRRVEQLVRRTVPSTGCEEDPACGEIVIFASRVTRLIEALHTAGIEIVEVGSR